LLAYFTRLLMTQPAWVRRARGVALALLAATLLVAFTGIGLPALLWASGWLTWPLKLGSPRAASISSLSLLVT
jgi:hypothetical protein